MTTKSKRRPSKLTELQAGFVDAKMHGLSDNAATLEAGGTNSSLLARSNTVKEELARAREEISDLTTLKRLDVIEGIMDGIGLARVQADAGNVIKGWVEIAKILGHYAPDVKRVELTIKEDRIQTHLRSLPMDELLKIASGESTAAITVDGSYHEVS